jgi:hypothetical protein
LPNPRVCRYATLSDGEVRNTVDMDTVARTWDAANDIVLAGISIR